MSPRFPALLLRLAIGAFGLCIALIIYFPWTYWVPAVLGTIAVTVFSVRMLEKHGEDPAARDQRSSRLSAPDPRGKPSAEPDARANELTLQ